VALWSAYLGTNKYRHSLASVPPIIRNGSEWFANLGVANSAGSKIFSVSGHVQRPGNYEVNLGTPFAELLEMAGGVRAGHKLKAVIPGGSSVPVLPAATIMQCAMDYDSLAQAGSALGAGSVIVMDDTTCMVEALERISYFYFVNPAAKCTPCREGTGCSIAWCCNVSRWQWIADLIRLNGRGG
jgi:NADH-quinone oxidoreductase subunit F